jgi:MFS family permease
MKPYRQFLLLTFATRLALAFSFATYVMFLISRGATLFQVSLINISFMIAIAIAELPTGIFADLFGRKRSFLISTLIMAAGLMVYFFSNSILLFITAEVVTGIGMTFRSGALEAWAVDAIAESGADISNDRLFSSEGVAKNAANIVGGLTGAYMGNLDLAYPWLAGAIVLMVISIYAAMVMTEPQQDTGRIRQSPLIAIKTILTHSVDYGLKRRTVLLLMIATLICAFFYQPLNMYWQPYFAGLAGEKIWILGWIWALISLCLMLGSYLVKHLPIAKNRRLALSVAVVFNTLPIIVAAKLAGFYPALSMFCIYEIARGFLEPIQSAFINDEIPSAERATILSLNQVFMRVGAMLGLLITGMVADKMSITTAWISAAIVGLVAIPIFAATKPSIIKSRIS